MKHSLYQGPKIGHPRVTITQIKLNLHHWIRERVAVNKSSSLNTVRQAIVGEGYSLHQAGPRIWQLECHLSFNSRHPHRILYRFKTWYKCLSNKMDTFSLLCPPKASSNWCPSQTSPPAPRLRPTSKSRAWARNWRPNPQPLTSSNNSSATTVQPLSTPPSWALSGANSNSSSSQPTVTAVGSPLRACWRHGAGIARWIMRRVTVMGWGWSSSLVRCGITTRVRVTRGIGIMLSLCRSKALIIILAGSPQMY